MDFLDRLINFLAIFAILLIVCLLIRELVCWYAKINRRIDLLEEQNRILREMLDEMQRSNMGDDTHSN